MTCLVLAIGEAITFGMISQAHSLATLTIPSRSFMWEFTFDVVPVFSWFQLERGHLLFVPDNTTGLVILVEISSAPFLASLFASVRLVPDWLSGLRIRSLNIKDRGGDLHEEIDSECPRQCVRS